MKSLEEREADRKARAKRAQQDKEEAAKILGTQNSGADTEEEEEGYEHLTVAQLKAELDKRQVEYKASDKKDDLIALLEQDDEQ